MTDRHDTYHNDVADHLKAGNKAFEEWAEQEIPKLAQRLKRERQRIEEPPMESKITDEHGTPYVVQNVFEDA